MVRRELRARAFMLVACGLPESATNVWGVLPDDVKEKWVRNAERYEQMRQCLGDVNEIAAHELVLYLDNTERLYRFKLGEFRLLARARDKGKPKENEASRFGWIVRMAAVDYERENRHGRRWTDMFPPATRHAAALELLEQFEGWYKCDWPRYYAAKTKH